MVYIKYILCILYLHNLHTCVFPQNVVPDLSYIVRSPVLEKWEGIKQLKAALWALVSQKHIAFFLILND